MRYNSGKGYHAGIAGQSRGMDHPTSDGMKTYCRHKENQKMRIDRTVFQSKFTKPQTPKEYGGHAYVLRESVVVLGLRILIAEIILGLLGLSFRIPVVYLLRQTEGPLVMWGAYAVVYAFFQIINVAVILMILLQWYNRTYIVQDEDIRIRSGVTRTSEILLKYDHIETVLVDQTVMGKLFNYGTVKITNPLIKKDIYFVNIPDPSDVARRIQKRTVGA